MITVTAATGQYGRLVIDALLKRGVPADDIVAAVRNPQKATDLAERGVQVREADYDRPETLVPAFTGSDKLLLIRSAVFGQRYPQMQNAVKAAAEANVGLIAYASFVNTDTSKLRLGEEHKQTEAAIRASGVPFVMLRNGAYTEMYTATLGPSLQYGAILGSAGDGKLSGATRADLAQAAAVVLSSDGHAGKIYELSGTPFTMADLAAEVSTQTGKTIIYQDMRWTSTPRPSGCRPARILRRPARRHQPRHRPRRLVHRQHRPAPAHRSPVHTLGRRGGCRAHHRPARRRRPAGLIEDPFKTCLLSINISEGNSP